MINNNNDRITTYRNYKWARYAAFHIAARERHVSPSLWCFPRMIFGCWEQSRSFQPDFCSDADAVLVRRSIGHHILIWLLQDATEHRVGLIKIITVSIWNETYSSIENLTIFPRGGRPWHIFQLLTLFIRYGVQWFFSLTEFHHLIDDGLCIR